MKYVVRTVLLLLYVAHQCLGWLLEHLHEHCGVEHVSSLDAAMDQARMHRIMHHHRHDDRHHHRDRDRQLQKLSCDELCDGCIEIDTVFHFFVFTYRGTTVLPHPTAAMQRYDAGDGTLLVSDFTTPAAFAQNYLRNQIDVTNTHLQGTPFRLKLANPPASYTTTDNNGYMRYPVDSFQEITANVGSGNLRTLDVYLSYNVLRQVESNPLTRVGLATLPSQQLLRNGDGVFLRYDVVAGGGFGGGVDLGVTLTHELGHWLGLYHTFRTVDGSAFGCEASPNDFVDDTPAHEGDSMFYDCRDYLSTNFLRQPFPDTCPGLPGRDPVLNYMNYVSADECLMQEGEFTCGQIQRMYYQWVFYREEVLMCPQGEMEVEWAYTFDREHDEENRVLLYRLEGSDRLVIFDSQVDHDDGAFLAQGILAVDICVPQNFDYVFEIQDSAGNGFSNRGEVAVLRNGERLASGSGNWGSTFTVAIPAVTPSPTSRPTRAPVSSPPTHAPTTALPTAPPIAPTASPTELPVASIVSTDSPTYPPTSLPTSPPTSPPTTTTPTMSPTTMHPTSSPTAPPTMRPTTIPTIVSPTSAPSVFPITSLPTELPRIPTAPPSQSLVTQPVRSVSPFPALGPNPTKIPSPYSPPVGTTYLPTSPPKLIKMMKSKKFDGMEKLGKSYRPPSSSKGTKMSTKSKSKKNAKGSKSKMESKVMNMDVTSSLSSSTKKSKGSANQGSGSKIADSSGAASASPTRVHDVSV